MHGVVWEMVRDFNTALVTGESRGDSSLDKQLFCGAGASSSVDPSDYAAFMRYALRSSYSASYTLSSLGFRCAKDI
ncbi:MAG: sulfatase activating formylglycine-generating enzyme [Arenicella sp.]|jgi:formylglycine-generating enzyme required for sulfatase activity